MTNRLALSKRTAAVKYYYKVKNSEVSSELVDFSTNASPSGKFNYAPR